ncbi:bifunctional metallophosphatase/5'-nucleotidase, partial [Bacillus sp. D-CC]
LVSHVRECKKPDLLVVAYHGGFERDLQTGEPTEVLTGENQGYAMCHEIEGIDILLTGHQHREMAQTVGNDVTILQTGCNGHSVGKVTVTFEKMKQEWVKKESYSELLTVQEIEADPDVLYLVADYEEKTQKWLDQPIGTIHGDMQISDAMQTRLQDHPFIEFINKIQ